jgi:hypothetical protein
MNEVMGSAGRTKTKCEHSGANSVFEMFHLLGAYGHMIVIAVSRKKIKIVTNGKPIHTVLRVLASTVGFENKTLRVSLFQITTSHTHTTMADSYNNNHIITNWLSPEATNTSIESQYTLRSNRCQESRVGISL